jgi:hypothetical protein
MIRRKRTPAAYRLREGNPIETDTDSLGNVSSGLLPRAVGSERRTTQRFPIQLTAELCVLEARIPGITVNISSGGLLLKCSHDSVKIGGRVKVRITNWPNSKEKKSVLMIDGAVVRYSTEYVAVRRIRYEFVQD